MNPLHYASIEGDLERVARLIDEGADINAPCEDRKWTPLHYAVENNRLQVAQYLIRKGCLLDQRNSFGETSLLIAANPGKLEFVEMLLASGADIGATDLEGWNLLHHAAICNNLEVVRIALESMNIDINTKIRFGRTALMLAVQRNRRDVVNLLLASGADIAACDDEDLNVLHYAAQWNSLDVVHVLLQRGDMDLNAKHIGGDTAMMIAAIVGHWAMCELLLASGADVNVKNNRNGITALYYIIHRKNVVLFRSLFNHGAYLEPFSYQEIYDNEETRARILRDAELCTASLLNKYNEDWLPSIYGKLRSPEGLPRIEVLKIHPFQKEATEIRKCVAEEIGSWGLGRVLDARSPVLKWLCPVTSRPPKNTVLLPTINLVCFI